jgi:hypothetical protein
MTHLYYYNNIIRNGITCFPVCKKESDLTAFQLSASEKIDTRMDISSVLSIIMQLATINEEIAVTSV